MRSVMLLLTTQVIFGMCGRLCAQDVKFTYDAAGNIGERKIQVIANPRIRYSPTEPDSLQTILESALSVFPNPGRGVVQIEGRLPADCYSAKVTIFNSSGGSVYTSPYNGQPLSIDLTTQSKGVYFLELRCAAHGHAATYKVITTD